MSRELVVDEVERPARVRLQRHGQRRPPPDGASPSLTLAPRETFGPIQPVDLVEAGDLALASQQDEQAPITEAMAP